MLLEVSFLLYLLFCILFCYFDICYFVFCICFVFMMTRGKCVLDKNCLCEAHSVRGLNDISTDDNRIGSQRQSSQIILQSFKYE